MEEIATSPAKPNRFGPTETAVSEHPDESSVAVRNSRRQPRELPGIEEALLALHDSRDFNAPSGGLLEPPERQGRKAFYGPAHLEQLEMITRLKGRGYSLASIKEMLDLWREGESLEAILAPAAGESPTIDLAELVSLLFPDGQADPDVLARAAALGLIKVTEEGIELRDSQDLDIGVRLIRLGVPPSEVLDEYEHLQQVTDGIAQRFANLFETHILPDAADPAQQLSELVRLARAAVEMSLMQSIKREGQQRLRSEPTIEEA